MTTTAIHPSFVVSSGRCGSTLISQVLRLESRVLSVSELFVALAPLDFDHRTQWSGDQLADVLLRPRPHMTFLLKQGLVPPEVLYPVGRRGASANARTGIPPIAVTAVPFCLDSTEPSAIDEAVDEIASVARSFEPAPAGVQLSKLLDEICLRRARDAWVERSGGSIRWVRELELLFPMARYLLVLRDGPATAMSMSQHPVFRLGAVRMTAVAQLGIDPLVDPPTGPQLDRCPAFVRAALEEDLMAADIPLEVFGRMWSLLTVELARWAAQTRQPIHIVQYEQLLERPADTLRALAKFVLGNAEEAWISAAVGLVNAPRQSEPVPPTLGRVCRVGTRASEKLRALA